MAAKNQRKKDIKEEIISRFMEYVLENGMLPPTVYKFCKESGIEEEDFYAHFGSLKGIMRSIWVSFYDKTEQLLQKNKDYASFGNKDKLLSFFYTFFELLTLNRSYVLFTLEHGKLSHKAEQFKELRRRIKDYAEELIEDANSNKSSRLGQRSPAIFSEGTWWHFMFLLKFWTDDDSAGFEKTDIAIEKSVTTVFDLFENTPLDSIIDFGKFLYKEKMA